MIRKSFNPHWAGGLVQYRTDIIVTNLASFAIKYIDGEMKTNVLNVDNKNDTITMTEYSWHGG